MSDDNCDHTIDNILEAAGDVIGGLGDAKSKDEGCALGCVAIALISVAVYIGYNHANYHANLPATSVVSPSAELPCETENK